MARRSWWLVLLCGCATLGCGGSAPKSAAPAGDGFAQKEAGAPPPAPQKQGAADPAAVNAATVAPMIVYTATLDVVVKDLDAATPEVDKLVVAHKGFVAKSAVTGDTGSRRTATYTIRVPAGAFGALKDGLLALGTPERNVVDTQDVTEEFVDVEARIKNLKEQEEKLNELLKEKRKEEKLEDVIKVSDRIYLVRGDIERAQGRRNYLQNRVQLSTVNVTLREIKDYKPPTAPTFGSRISDTFSNSWGALVDFGEGLVLAAVGLVPWTPIWLPAVVALTWSIRRLRRQAREDAEEQERERTRRRSRNTAEDAVEETPADQQSPPEEPNPPA